MDYKPILYNVHIALNYIGHFVCSPLNSYFIYIGYWTLIYIIIIIIKKQSLELRNVYPITASQVVSS